LFSSAVSTLQAQTTISAICHFDAVGILHLGSGQRFMQFYAKSDVVTDRHRKKHGLLERQADLTAQSLNINIRPQDGGLAAIGKSDWGEAP
jgi:hypothetical protein